MQIRSVPAAAFVILFLVSLIAGCSSPAPPQGIPPQSPVPAPTDQVPGQIREAGSSSAPPARENITEQLASVHSTNPVWLEAYRMFRNIRSTTYVHPPYTDDDSGGIYEFDCLGFVDHVLMAADMTSYREIGRNVNPSIESYAAYFSKLDEHTPNSAGWTKVIRPVDLEPGDICLWLKPSTLDTGHMWIIAGEPERNPRRPVEVIVRIFDSTGTAHTSDSRTGSAFRTGLGSGILGYMVDGEGKAEGLFWMGGLSTGAGEKDTTIVCGRLNR